MTTKALPVSRSDLSSSLLKKQASGEDWDAWGCLIEVHGEDAVLDSCLSFATAVLGPVQKDAEHLVNSQAINPHAHTAQLILAADDGSELVVETLQMAGIVEDGKRKMRRTDLLNIEQYCAWTNQREGVATAQATLAKKRADDARAIYESLTPEQRIKPLGEVFPELRKQLNKANDNAILEG
jgi:hypothetical protein